MYFGGHISTSGGIDKAAERAVEMGAEAIQVFTQSPRAWRATNHKPENVARWLELRKQHGIKGAVAHAIYLINIAAADDEIRRKSVAALADTVDVAETLELDAVIFHPGSHKSLGIDSCIERWAEGLQEALDRTKDTWVLMENSAGAGGTMGRTVEELALLFDRIGPHPRLGICIDTCHWFVSGVDITDREVLDAALADIDDTIGLDRLRALHINDSTTPLGSNRDRHANIGEGEIGDGMATFLGHPKLQGLPAYLEVPGPNREGTNADELSKIRALHAAGVKASKVTA